MGLNASKPLKKTLVHTYVHQKLKSYFAALIWIILHCRKAFPELVRAIKAETPSQGGVYHGFSGSYQQALQLIDLGLKVGGC